MDNLEREDHMKVRYVERHEFIETSDPNPIYRVTFTAGPEHPEPWTNLEAEHELVDVANIHELLRWISDNAHGRPVEAWVKAWDVYDDGTPYECLYQLL